MRRAIFTMTAALVLTLATALPVASSGLTDVTLSCDDGSSFTATLDTESLEGVTQAVLAMGLYPRPFVEQALRAGAALLAG